MSKKTDKKKQEVEDTKAKVEETKAEETQSKKQANDKGAEKESEPKKESAANKDETTLLKEQLFALNDKYLRLSAEFDNYRKRTLKEKSDMLKSAGENVLIKILPVIDNFERALNSIETSNDKKAVKEGVQLIYSNFKDFLKQQGVAEIEAMHQEFDTDLHEALTKIPAQDKKLKGKIVDIIEKGYKLNDKVIRFSKVVVGE